MEDVDDDPEESEDRECESPNNGGAPIQCLGLEEVENRRFLGSIDSGRISMDRLLILTVLPLGSTGGRPILAEDFLRLEPLGEAGG
jgi:hypothetical protein